jgi:Zn-finger nucleic acid-binding protein
MKCPHCADTTLVMSDRQGVEIDYCPQCRGVWLDRGELDKLLQREAAPPHRSQDRRDDDDDDDRYPRRRRPFWAELFD